MADNSQVDVPFGPVPSRRLGRSLGINNLPPKVCTYSCVYCQLGRTARMSNRRRESHAPVAYLAVPTRPPAEKWVRPPDEETVNRAYRMVAREVDRVELLTGYESSAFAATGNSEEDILSITAVHPMRAEAVQDLLRRNGDR